MKFYLLALSALLLSSPAHATDTWDFPSTDANPSVGITPARPVVCEDGARHRRLHALDQIQVVDLPEHVLLTFRSYIVDCERVGGEVRWDIISNDPDSCRRTSRVRVKVGPRDGARISGRPEQFVGQFAGRNFCATAVLFPKRSILDNANLKVYTYTYHYFGARGDYEWWLTARYVPDAQEFGVGVAGGAYSAARLSPDATQNIEEWLKRQRWNEY